MARGTLRIFLGAAPGVGKTYEMLEEAHRLGERGEDVVVAFALDHGRSRHHGRSWRGSRSSRPGACPTGARSSRRWTSTPSWPGRRGPRWWTNTPTPISRAAATTKRWQDVDVLLDAGINVLSTVNVQHLASLGDVVSAITDVRQAETVPDDVVRRADQIDLVDISA